MEHAEFRVLVKLKQVVQTVIIGLENTPNLVRNSNCRPLCYGAGTDVSEEYIESILMI
jgi:hypothetical protein